MVIAGADFCEVMNYQQSRFLGTYGKVRTRMGHTGCWEVIAEILAVMGSGAWICCSMMEGIYYFWSVLPLFNPLKEAAYTLIDSLPGRWSSKVR